MKLILKILLISLGMTLFAGCGSDFEWFPGTNFAPVANAVGPGQPVFAGDLVTLDGSGSSDPDGDSLTYTWKFTEPIENAPTLILTDPAKPTFTANGAGTYVISLVVTDGKLSSTSSVTITVALPALPAAKAGADQKVALGAEVTLDGRSSTYETGGADTNGDKLTYLWAFVTPKPPNAGNVLLSDAKAAQPTFKADFTGTYIIQLEVWDRFGKYGGKDTVTVHCNLGSITVTW